MTCQQLPMNINFKDDDGYDSAMTTENKHDDDKKDQMRVGFNTGSQDASSLMYFPVNVSFSFSFLILY